MSDIQRFHCSPRLSRIVVHKDVVYLAGMTSSDRSGDITAQTKNILDTIDERLASVGSSKEKMLSVQIWLQDIDRDFTGMNAVWEAWVPASGSPARATCEAKLAAPDLLVEIIVTAAV